MTQADSSAASTRPGRLGIGIISAGRVGTVLGAALRGVEHQIVGVHAVSAASQDRADALLHGVPLLSVEEIVERSEMVLLAVPDDALADLVSGLANLKCWQPGQLVAHTSGRYGIDVLAPAQACGAIPLAIHPAMTFSGTSMDLSRLVGCPMAVTAPATVLPIAQAFAVELGGEPFVVAEADRPAYHAALAHAANHLHTLIGQSTRILEEIGIDNPGGTLRPLVSAALDRALREGDAGLTGPVSRGDAATVTTHLQELEQLAASAQAAGNDKLTDVPGTYRALARATLNQCAARGILTPAQVDAVAAALETATPETAEEDSAQPESGLPDSGLADK